MALRFTAYTLLQVLAPVHVALWQAQKQLVGSTQETVITLPQTQLQTDGVVAGEEEAATKNTSHVTRTDLLQLLHDSGWYTSEESDHAIRLSCTDTGHVFWAWGVIYGLPVSYTPLFLSIHSLLVKPHPAGQIAVFSPDAHGNERHVDRMLNIESTTMMFIQQSRQLRAVRLRFLLDIVSVQPFFFLLMYYIDCILYFFR